MICAQVRDSGGDAYNRWPATLLAKVEFGKRWTFGDDYTRQHFGMYKRRFIRHHRRDRHYDFSQDFELPEFRERLLVEMYPGAKPRHASTGWYWVANLLLLTWPYRVWLDSICQRRRYEYVKEIVTTPPTAPSMVTPSTTTRVFQFTRNRISIRCESMSEFLIASCSAAWTEVNSPRTHPLGSCGMSSSGRSSFQPER